MTTVLQVAASIGLALLSIALFLLVIIGFCFLIAKFTWWVIGIFVTLGLLVAIIGVATEIYDRIF